MAFTAITGDVPVQPGVKAYNVFASGAITKGQGVALIQGSISTQPYVYVPDASSQRLFGVAAYTVADGDPVAIYGLDNLVQAKLSGAQSAGTMVGLYYDGMLSDLVKYDKFGVVVKSTSATGNGEVLLLGRSN